MSDEIEKQTRQVRNGSHISMLRAIWSCADLRRCGISIAKARQRCYHHMGAVCRTSHDRSITDAAALRQAEAKMEMLKGRQICSL